ncbi:NAD(P)/FAD-dependent oxidoreductase [Polymorphobacter arshaanensis]|uniref:NAD(P)/FAD-dependent oxidoreductase n=1 Tax=Glacieibacterium arshaanense TaxID=2511025 RepID=A0A4Y9EMX3_9SPHN|nr:NAD(P)/FAD-dependent oxidoreductase [Polymorphobacter arshaanensis]TFU03183.1 NAD(P)/FAD-dependent oxidoreductase [Polymorphobacter arshaanensis]
MTRLVVIGSGAMGLAAAWEAARAGHDVTLLEAGDVPGGMAAHFDFDGLSIERFYHFICTTDFATFKLLEELGIADRLRWRATTMGHFSGGRLHEWGNPVALLRYPGLSLWARLRYGVLAFVSTRRDRWDALETQSAREWITRWGGAEVYDKMWKPLFDLKFYDYADPISAAWIWTRVKRIGRSRKSLFEEKLGYLEGGSETLVTALANGFAKAGGKLRLSTPALRVETTDGHVTGVVTPESTIAADAVISTMPTPLVSKLVPDLPADWKARYDAIANIGVCCLIFKLSRSVTPHFWVNITEPGVPVPGIIEFSNLRPLGGDTPGGDTIVYVPYYMPVTHEKFGWSDDALLDEAFAAIRRVNPAVTQADVLGRRVARLRHAQPICEPGFAAKIPPVETPIAGLQIADTCFYYPEDRGISESVRLGREMAARLGQA